MYQNNMPDPSIVNASPDWITPEHRKILLCFVHIPKAAGTTLNNVLYQVYGRHFFSYHSRLSELQMHELNLARAANVFAIGGHSKFGFHATFGPEHERSEDPDGVFRGRDVRYISIVRNPVDRLHSYYRFVKTFAPHRLHRDTRHMECDEFFAHMVEIGNKECTGRLQCSLICGTSPTAAAAIQRIKDDYFLVGVADQATQFIEELSAKLNWPPFTLERKNASPISEKAAEERQAIEAFVDHYTPEEKQLYDYVKGRETVS